MTASLLERVAKRIGPQGLLAATTPEQRERMLYEWRIMARPEQLPPEGDTWRVWLVLAGRGWGKTRTAAEWTRLMASTYPKSRGALIARTAKDVRSVLLEGVSGILNVSPPDFMPEHNPSKSQVTWPNGSMALTYSAEEPKGLRGPAFDWAVCDELAAWPMLSGDDGEPNVPTAWTQLQYGLRQPNAKPRVLVATTPRPIKVIRELLKSKDTHVTRGKTMDNAANLSGDFIKSIHERYAGSRLGRQELDGEVLDTVTGALWTHELIDMHRHAAPLMYTNIVVGVDPAGSAKATADETGIVVAGVSPCSCKGKVELHAFVFDDLTGRYSPQDWGVVVVEAYHRYRANIVVAERNFGGEWIPGMIGLIDPSVAVTTEHAAEGKNIRAEPVSALYEQGKVHHVPGSDLRLLEDEMCNYAPLVSTKSPGRLDALVWAVRYLLLNDGPTSINVQSEGSRLWSRSSGLL